MSSAHSPIFPTLHLCHNFLQPFCCFTYITAHSPTLPLLHLHHNSFSNPSFASPTSQALHLIHLASHPCIKAFTSHGYTQSPLLQKQLSHASHHSNPNPLPCDPHHFSLITTYYPNLHHLKQICREGFHIPSLGPSNQDLLTKPPTVTFRKLSNLHQLIVDTSVSPKSCHPHQLPILQ